MHFKYVLKTAYTGISSHKSRSALTILGIVIGITSIILMMSIGEAAENLILNEIGGMGAETIIIRPGKEPTGPTDIAGTLFADSLKVRDLEKLRRKENIPELVTIAPAVIVPGSVSFEGETYRPEIIGGSVEFFAEAFNIELQSGQFFDEIDIRSRAAVAVIGDEVKDELFGNRYAVGEYIKIKDKKFRVVGVIESTGQATFLNFDKLVIIPHTTAQTYLLGIDYYHEIMLRASSPEAVARTVRDIEITLREAHNITDPDKDDFFVITQQGVVDQIKIIIGTLTLFLSSVVAIALVVAGIGIMNIMLVSVTERTREIGLRKALGATERDISRQFLVESILLTAVGGVIGVILGAFLSFIIALTIRNVTNLAWEFVFPISAVILGVGVSSLVGLIFGIYPARQAAKKSPIEALRYE